MPLNKPADMPFNTSFYEFATHKANRHPNGDFAGVVKELLRAGIVVDETLYSTGHSAIDAVISVGLRNRSTRDTTRHVTGE
ncbi:MAG: hypothetical protein EXS36_08790 [Pedosphaera sp.]|nr:hypothetical protein [Pedosphaera sp.]